MTYNRLSNCVGVIDSDYRGEVMIRLIQDEDTSKPLCIKKWANSSSNDYPNTKSQL